MRNTRRSTKNRRGGFSPNVPRDRVIPELVSRGAQCQCHCGFARARNVRDDAALLAQDWLVSGSTSRSLIPSPPRPCLLPFTPQPTHRHMAHRRVRTHAQVHTQRLDRPTPESQAHVFARETAARVQNVATGLAPESLARTRAGSLTERDGTGGVSANIVHLEFEPPGHAAYSSRREYCTL